MSRTYRRTRESVRKLGSILVDLELSGLSQEDRERFLKIYDSIAVAQTRLGDWMEELGSQE